MAVSRDSGYYFWVIFIKKQKQKEKTKKLIKIKTCFKLIYKLF